MEFSRTSPRHYFVKAKNFALVVKQIKENFQAHDTFELDLDAMKVKGDLAVLQSYFQKPLFAKTASLDMAKRAVKAHLPCLVVPPDFEIDEDLKKMIEARRVVVLREACNLPEIL